MILEFLQDTWESLLSKLSNIRHWIAYRTYDKYHLVPTNLKPGYYDIDIRMLHSCFTLLEDYVEVECASSALWTEGRKLKVKDWRCKIIMHPKTPRFVSSIIWNALGFRSPELGLLWIEEQVEYYNGLPPNSVPIGASPEYSEIRDLYLWWKGRDLRPETYDLSGFTTFFNQLIAQYGSLYIFKPVDGGNHLLERVFQGNVDEETEYNRLLTLTGTLDDGRDKEDDDMLAKLVKLRHFLWS